MINPEMQLVEDIDRVEMKAMRDGYGEALLELGKDERVWVVVADLMESTRVKDFAKHYPDRFVEMGIAEQNMMGVAAGMALEGKIPFVNSFACFSPGRNYDQLRVSVCVGKANVKVVGGHAGAGNGEDGANQQSFEDVGMVRSLPNLVVVSPADYEQVKRATEAIAAHEGPVYMRMTAPARPVVTSKMTPFVLGKAQVLRRGGEVGLIVSGAMVYEGLRAAEELSGKVDVEVINIHTIKPIDESEIIRVAQKCKRVVVAEEHQIIGGLGSAVAEVLVKEGVGVKMRMVGMSDVFGESGKPEELLVKYGMSKEAIIKAIRELAGR